jgi:hypothetical protein
MFSADSHVKLIYDHDKKFLGVVLSPQIWDLVQRDVAPVLEKALERLDPEHKPQEKPEPLKDWELLASCWDFKYPLDSEVSCQSCGASTPDWRADEPRRFRLSIANLGGLASFICASCGAKVIKKHFKDHVAVECHVAGAQPLRQKIQKLPPRK